MADFCHLTPCSPVGILRTKQLISGQEKETGVRVGIRFRV